MAQAGQTKEIFLESLDRCAKSETFVDDFYTRFTAMSPKIRVKFAHTDMAQHRPRLLKSLQTMASAVAGEQSGLHELGERAKTHNRRHLNITPDMYALWSEAMLETVREHDARWSPEVERAWKQTTEMLIHYMVKRY